MNVWAILVAIIATVALVRALLIGSATIDGEGLRRDDEPASYWFTIACNVALIFFLVWAAFE